MSWEERCLVVSFSIFGSYNILLAFSVSFAGVSFN